ncbi:FAD/NAD(P)-binding protein [Streptomyces hydrogenans]|uniref:FAD/NAD(P)-binding protein n=1 Tax=Streptomyces hydrogenans TaxID=1873719 RepID=UPI003646E681
MRLTTEAPAERFGAAFCGGGPAVIGPVIAAARRGQLQEFLDSGILLVEPDLVGPGGIAHYRIPANSLGGAFLEFLDALDAFDGDAFLPLRDAEETHELRRHADEYPPLSVVAAFLRRVGDRVVALLAGHPRCRVVTRASVHRVTLREGGDGAVVTALAEDGSSLEFLADRVVLAMGGTPLPGYATQELTPGLSLGAYADKVCHSESLVDRRKDMPARLVDAVARDGRVVIVGGAHSAWSVAGLLLRSPELVGRTEAPEITVLHRTPVQLFYLSTAEAEADGYPFDPVTDVCADSGRVNRFGGLRGPARLLAQAALGMTGETVPVRLIRIGEETADREAASALDAAAAVVVATGYQARLPELLAEGGGGLTARVEGTGTVVTEDALLVLADGSTDERLLAYGLGAGLRISGATGGEPGYTRRADGVWLYQNGIGDIVLDHLPALRGDVRRHAHSTTTEVTQR